MWVARHRGTPWQGSPPTASSVQEESKNGVWGPQGEGGRYAPTRHDPPLGVNPLVPNVVQTCGLPLTGSPLFHPAPPPAAVRSAPALCGEIVPLEFSKNRGSLSSTQRAGSPGRGEEAFLQGAISPCPQLCFRARWGVGESDPTCNPPRATNSSSGGEAKRKVASAVGLRLVEAWPDSTLSQCGAGALGLQQPPPFPQPALRHTTAALAASRGQADLFPIPRNTLG